MKIMFLFTPGSGVGKDITFGVRWKQEPLTSSQSFHQDYRRKLRQIAGLNEVLVLSLLLEKKTHPLIEKWAKIIKR
jgi:hypothetical protein